MCRHLHPRFVCVYKTVLPLSDFFLVVLVLSGSEILERGLCTGSGAGGVAGVVLLGRGFAPWLPLLPRLCLELELFLVASILDLFLE